MVGLVGRWSSRRGSGYRAAWADARGGGTALKLTSFSVRCAFSSAPRLQEDQGGLLDEVPPVLLAELGNALRGHQRLLPVLLPQPGGGEAPLHRALVQAGVHDGEIAEFDV